MWLDWGGVEVLLIGKVLLTNTLFDLDFFTTKFPEVDPVFANTAVLVIVAFCFVFFFFNGCTATKSWRWFAAAAPQFRCTRSLCWQRRSARSLAWMLLCAAARQEGQFEKKNQHTPCISCTTLPAFQSINQSTLQLFIKKSDDFSMSSLLFGATWMVSIQ